MTSKLKSCQVFTHVVINRIASNSKGRFSESDGTSTVVVDSLESINHHGGEGGVTGSSERRQPQRGDDVEEEERRRGNLLFRSSFSC